MLLALTLLAQISVNTDMAFACESLDVLAQSVDAMDGLAGEGMESRVRSAGQIEDLLDSGKCIIFEQGTRLHLRNRPDGPAWLLAVRVEGESREWWTVFRAVWDPEAEDD